ncbi:unnamed protein product [Paramecium octaurelia]|uniref:Uncharacterized protein n=1 Tax=Paramecium octaurelia TaxID=43137 RepID=A0A8S1THB5_PAROT|nr:unnamed protein product [Paramecium octaurelia]
MNKNYQASLRDKHFFKWCYIIRYVQQQKENKENAEKFDNEMINVLLIDQYPQTKCNKELLLQLISEDFDLKFVKLIYKPTFQQITSNHITLRIGNQKKNDSPFEFLGNTTKQHRFLIPCIKKLLHQLSILQPKRRFDSRIAHNEDLHQVLSFSTYISKIQQLWSRRINAACNENQSKKREKKKTL